MELCVFLFLTVHSQIFLRPKRPTFTTEPKNETFLIRAFGALSPSFFALLASFARVNSKFLMPVSFSSLGDWMPPV